MWPGRGALGLRGCRPEWEAEGPEMNQRKAIGGATIRPSTTRIPTIRFVEFVFPSLANLLEVSELLQFH